MDRILEDAEDFFHAARHLVLHGLNPTSTVSVPEVAD
jgi:hypothetical protein